MNILGQQAEAKFQELKELHDRIMTNLQLERAERREAEADLMRIRAALTKLEKALGDDGEAWVDFLDIVALYEAARDCVKENHSSCFVDGGQRAEPKPPATSDVGLADLIKELQALEDKATPGPWTARMTEMKAGNIVESVIDAPSWHELAMVNGIDDYGETLEGLDGHANAQFIARLRNSAPQLLAAAGGAKADDEVRQALCEVLDRIGGDAGSLVAEKASKEVIQQEIHQLVLHLEERARREKQR